MKARMARFYGWDDYYLDSLDVSTFNDYFTCIGALESHETLLEVRSVTFPNMSKGDRNRFFADLKKSAYNIVEEEARQFNTEDIARELTRKFLGG